MGMNKRRYECPDRFIRLGNSCYYLSAQMDTWQNAHFTCTDMGSHLAILDRKWEDRNMRSLLKKPEAALLERWIGGIWDWQQHCWMWGETGTPLKYQGFPRKGRRSGDNTWHCIAMDPTIAYRWKSASCLERKHYVCETPLKNTGAKSALYPRKNPKRRRKGKGRKGQKKEQNEINNETIETT